MDAKFHHVPVCGVSHVNARVRYPTDDPPDEIVIDGVTYKRVDAASEMAPHSIGGEDGHLQGL